MIKESFSAGFVSGKTAGEHQGETNANVKMLIRLVEITNLSNEEILTVLNKEGDSIYIQKLEELREAS